MKMNQTLARQFCKMANKFLRLYLLCGGFIKSSEMVDSEFWEEYVSQYPRRKRKIWCVRARKVKCWERRRGQLVWLVGEVRRRLRGQKISETILLGRLIFFEDKSVARIQRRGGVGGWSAGRGYWTHGETWFWVD